LSARAIRAAARGPEPLPAAEGRVRHPDHRERSLFQYVIQSTAHQAGRPGQGAGGIRAAAGNTPSSSRLHPPPRGGPASLVAEESHRFSRLCSPLRIAAPRPARKQPDPDSRTLLTLLRVAHPRDRGPGAASRSPGKIIVSRRYRIPCAPLQRSERARPAIPGATGGAPSSSRLHPPPRGGPASPVAEESHRFSTLSNPLRIAPPRPPRKQPDPDSRASLTLLRVAHPRGRGPSALSRSQGKFIVSRCYQVPCVPLQRSERGGRRIRGAAGGAPSAPRLHPPPRAGPGSPVTEESHRFSTLSNPLRNAPPRPPRKQPDPDSRASLTLLRVGHPRDRGPGALPRSPGKIIVSRCYQIPCVPLQRYERARPAIPGVTGGTPSSPRLPPPGTPGSLVTEESHRFSTLSNPLRIAPLRPPRKRPDPDSRASLALLRAAHPRDRGPGALRRSPRKIIVSRCYQIPCVPLQRSERASPAIPRVTGGAPSSPKLHPPGTPGSRVAEESHRFSRLFNPLRIAPLRPRRKRPDPDSRASLALLRAAHPRDRGPGALRQSPRKIIVSRRYRIPCVPLQRSERGGLAIPGTTGGPALFPSAPPAAEGRPCQPGRRGISSFQYVIQSPAH
jgi:hypothetical protein